MVPVTSMATSPLQAGDVLELTVPNRTEDARSVYMSGTLNGNAIAAAAGLATLDVIAEENGPARLIEIGSALLRGNCTILIADLKPGLPASSE